jgi:hypothetical protein
MALYKYITKEKDKLVEGEEFVKANELLEEILKEERIKYFHPNRDMKLVLLIRLLSDDIFGGKNFIG